MNENAIKSYATWARRELMSEVERRCALYGISDEKDCPYDTESIGGRVMSSEERQKRRELVGEAKRGMQALVERAAYTWFNRMLAIRFMECNDRLPSQTRMFSAPDGSFAPQILKEALSVEIDNIDRSKAAKLVQDGDDEGLFRYLFLLQCDELADCMPAVFDKVGEDPLVLLLPDGLLRPEGVIGKLVTDIAENDWCDGVQIVGWMYQFYISEKKDEFFASKRKASAEDIPAATQLFTPEWIVKYLVQNSLGRLWMFNHPESHLAEKMDYFIVPDPDAHEDFQVVSSPEEITCIDPACGSGHICVYMFDLLAAIYEECGYSRRDIPRLILEKNLTGIEIDHRAGALASFALAMKASEYDSRFLRRGVQPRIVVLEKVELEHEHIDAINAVRIEQAKLGEPFLLELDDLLNALAHLDEIGSLFVPTDEDMASLRTTVTALEERQGLFGMGAQELLQKALEELAPLHETYSAVATNPPYMGTGALQKWASDWIKKNYPDEKGDLCTCFIARAHRFGVGNGYSALITMQSWMFLSSYEKMREKLIDHETIISMAHLGARAFDAIGGEVVSTTATVFQHSKGCETEGIYIRLIDPAGEQGKSAAFIEAIKDTDCGWFYRANAENFKSIPGWPIAYWANEGMIKSFSELTPLASIARPRQGLVTGDNERFLKNWWEVSTCKIGFACSSREESIDSGAKWFPCNKGGGFRKWYGNNEYVVNWEHDGAEIQSFVKNGRLASRPQNKDYYFREGLTWSALSTGSLSMRFSPVGFISEHKGTMCFADSHVEHMFCLAALNSSPANECLKILCPTLDFGEGAVGKVPLPHVFDDSVYGVAEECLAIARDDYDAFEPSWDFRTHPLVGWSRELWDVTSIGATMHHFYGRHPEVSSPLELCYVLWQGQCRERFNQLKSNEEELNRIFARIYNMEGEVPIEVPDEKVSVRLADKTRDIKSFISYAVGCILGRYSLDVDGLVMANQGDGLAEYLAKIPEPTFMPDDDGIIPITDTEYFHDDATGFFVDFVRTVYGEEALEENLAFIADALGGSGTPRGVIRDYFMNGFFADHCKTYQKRPIYWLFDSGKKGGFRALVYMHRYRPDLLAKLRTDYVHEQQDRYRTQIEHIDDALESADRKQQADLKKRRKKLTEQLSEISVFEEKVHHLADQMIEIDLDDGVKVNYAKLQDVLAKIK